MAATGNCGLDGTRKVTIRTLFGDVVVEADADGIITAAPRAYRWWVGKRSDDAVEFLALGKRSREVAPRRARRARADDSGQLELARGA